MNLTETLHSEQLTNDQRLVISEIMSGPRPIRSARLLGNGHLLIWVRVRDQIGRTTAKSTAYRIDPTGRIWTMSESVI